MTSIVVYVGNNEDYQIQEQEGLTYDYEDKDPQQWLQTDFPARVIYEKLLPEVVAAESPHTPYHPGSPWSGGRPTSDPTIGDLHQWTVWHGTQAKYQLYGQRSGRFNTEFGLEALPHLDTIKYYCRDDTLLYPQSRLLDFHNKAADHERKIAIYVAENFRWRTDIRGFIHLTQMVQAEAVWRDLPFYLLDNSIVSRSLSGEADLSDPFPYLVLCSTSSYYVRAPGAC